MMEQNGSGDIRLQFKDICEWVDFSQNAHPNDDKDIMRASRNIRGNGGPEFFGVATADEGYNLMRTGWPEGLRRMKRVMEACHSLIKLESPAQEIVSVNEGGMPNIENYLMGVPEDMNYLVDTKIDAPPSYLKIQCEMAVFCIATPDQLMWAGAVVFAAMEALKAQGCHTELLISHTVGELYNDRGTGARVSSIFPLPSLLDMDTVAFLFTHPATFRVVVFSIYEHLPKHVRDRFGFNSHGGYGRPTRMRAEGVDGVLSISHICSMFRTGWGDQDKSTWEANCKIAQEMLNSLVDTKFQSYCRE